MGKKKRKYNPGAACPSEKTEQPVYEKGCYVSALSGEQAQKAQKNKTVFMLISTLLYAVTLFLPVDGRNVIAPIVWLLTLYLIFDIALIVFSVYASYAGQKKQRVTICFDGKNAPKGGFKRHTFVTYEIFNAMHVVYAAAEIAIVCLSFDVWGLLSAIAATGSAVSCFISRQILFRAYENAEFIPPKSDADGNAADGTQKEDGDADGAGTAQGASEEEKRDDPAEEFYGDN